MSRHAQLSPATPDWLRSLVSRVGSIEANDLSRFAPPEDGSGRHSAVLILLAGDDLESADVLLLRRSPTMRSHPGQVAFPGGATDPEDSSSTATALRESTEEVGLRAGSVEVLAELPALFLPPSGFVVTPVLAHWTEPHEVGVVDQAEVAEVRRVRLSELLDARHRFTVRHPSGFVGPGFEAGGLFVWGFTAGLLDRLLRLADWELPWDRERIRDLP
ncbi:MAG TPA: CoA pyrophosphatase [Jatrophihabitans sp.]